MFVAGKLFQKAGEGSGGGDKHNKGYFVDESALTTAYPTAEAGDYAIVESTDTVWIWDSDNSEWVDSDQKGQVTSVNNQTGDVTITASDLGALVNNSTYASAGGLSILGTDASNQSVAVGTGSNATAGWTTAIGKNAKALGSFSTTVGHETETSSAAQHGIAFGYYAKAKAWGAVQIGQGTNTVSSSIKFRDWQITDSSGNIEPDRLVKSINKYSSMPTAASTNEGWIVQYTGTTDANYTHGYIYECVSVSSSAVATSSNPDVTVSVNVATFETQITTTGQYVFEYDAGTDAWYDSNNNPVVLADYGITKEGVSVSQDTITIDYTATEYTWTRVDIQPAPVIPDPLPSQTGQSGKFLTTDGTDASWGTISALQNTATGTDALTILGTPTNQLYGVNIGKDSWVSGMFGTAIGSGAYVNGSAFQGLAIGYFASVGANYAIQIAGGQGTNNDANTLKVANGNGNFEIMSADGTVPTARLTKVNTTATLAVADWSSNTQTVTVSGVTATSVVFVSPAPASASDYASAGILCTAQAANSLTFTCTTTPTNAITVNVVCM